jgi:hypothetical protein
MGTFADLRLALPGNVGSRCINKGKTPIIDDLMSHMTHNDADGVRTRLRRSGPSQCVVVGINSHSTRVCLSVVTDIVTAHFTECEPPETS